MSELTNLLTDEIKRELDDLKTIDSGSREQNTAINNVIKLYRLKIEEERSEVEAKKIDYDYQVACQKHHFDVIENKTKHDDEIGLKAMEYDKQRKENIFKWCLGIAELILPLMFYAKWMKVGLKFEETGTFTSSTFRGLFTHFKPTKK